MLRLLRFGIPLVLIAACGGDRLAAPPPIDGSYHLTAVDGHDLPFTVLDLGNYRADLVMGTLEVNGDGTYVLETDYRLDDGVKLRAGADSDAGRWAIDDGAISLTSAHGNISSAGTIDGATITLQRSTRLFVFRK